MLGITEAGGMSLQIRPEAVEAAEKAFAYEPPDPNTGLVFSAGMRAAIAAFCEAERLTVERRFATYDAVHGPSDPQQRLAGPWHPTKEER